MNDKHGEKQASYLWLSLGLLCIVGTNWYIRHDLEHGILQEYPVLSHHVLKHPWKLLMPVDVGQAEGAVNEPGTYYWFTTGLTVVDLLNKQLSRTGAFYLLNALLIIASFWVGWSLFRSAVFSYTLAICMAFGTQFHWLYNCSSIVGFYLFMIYLEVNFLCFARVLFSPGQQWRYGFVFSLVIFSLNHEQWLDYLVFLSAASVFTFIVSWRAAEWERVRSSVFLFASSLLIGILYLSIRLNYGRQQYLPGSESEMVFTYNHFSLALEDVLSNVLTYIYIALSNYLPPCLVSSSSLYQLGPAVLVEEQHGYSANQANLLVMHHLFLWYFYAGIVFVLFCHGLFRSAVRAFRSGTPLDLYLTFFLLLIATGFAVHSMVKYRPYLSVPLLTYKCMTSNFGVALLIAYLLMLAMKLVKYRWMYCLCVTGVWGLILYSGLTRPHFLSHLSAQVGSGPIPDPWSALLGASP